MKYYPNRFLQILGSRRGPLRNVITRSLAKGRTKYFCIGSNKTGTTSLARAFEELGYPVADQRKAELLAARHYFQGDFEPIVRYCKSAQVFQDVPFSWPKTYKYLDRAFPGSKFILSVRENAEEWYRSLIRFHSQKFGRDGEPPTAKDLRKADYVEKCFMYNAVMIHGAPSSDPYNKDILMAYYEEYNRAVLQYFDNRPSDLLVINLSASDSYSRFLDFLGVDSPYEDFPWENRSL